MSLPTLLGRVFLQCVLAMLALAPSVWGATLAVQPNVNYLDYTFLLAYVAAIVFCIAVVRALIARMLPEGWRGAIVALTSAVVTGALFVDLRLFVLLGVHADGPVVRRYLQSPNANLETQLGWATLKVVGMIVLGLVALELVGFGTWRVLRRREQGLATAMVLGLLASLGVTFAGARTLVDPRNPSAAAMPLQFLAHAGEASERRELRYPQVLEGKLATQPNLVFIAVESWRDDTLTPELMPKVSALLGEEPQRCWRAPHHVSGGHSTERGVFSLLYGVDATYYGAFAHAALPSLPIAWLKAHGYRASALVASPLLTWNDAGFMTPQFDPYVEPSSTESWQRDAEVVERAIRYIPSPGGPYVLFLFLDATHVGYSYPPEFEIDKPVLREDFGTMIGRERLSSLRTEVRNRYRNSLRYVDDNLGRLVASLRGNGRDTVVILTGDHGEELWDQGMFGHSAPRFYRSRIDVPLIACAFGSLSWGNTPTASPTTHADVWPTVLGLIAPEVKATDYASGTSVFDAASRRIAVVAGAGFPDEAPDVAVLDATHKLWLRKDWTRDDLFAITRADDADDRPAPDEASERTLIGLLQARLQKFRR